VTAFDQWKVIFERQNTAENADFQNLSTSVVGNLKKAKGWLADLSKTNQIVESNRSNFKSIDDDTLAKRKLYVQETAATINEISEKLQSADTAAKIKTDVSLQTGEKETHDGELREIIGAF